MNRTRRYVATLCLVTLLASLTFVTLVQAQEMDGAKVFRDNCTKCHTERSPMEKTDAEWAVTINHMRTLGGMTAKESRAVLKFLQDNNGK